MLDPNLAHYTAEFKANLVISMRDKGERLVGKDKCHGCTQRSIERVRVRRAHHCVECFQAGKYCLSLDEAAARDKQENDNRTRSSRCTTNQSLQDTLLVPVDSVLSRVSTCLVQGSQPSSRRDAHSRSHGDPTIAPRFRAVSTKADSDSDSPLSAAPSSTAFDDMATTMDTTMTESVPLDSSSPLDSINSPTSKDTSRSRKADRVKANEIKHIRTVLANLLEEHEKKLGRLRHYKSKYRALKVKKTKPSQLTQSLEDCPSKLQQYQDLFKKTLERAVGAEILADMYRKRLAEQQLVKRA